MARPDRRRKRTDKGYIKMTIEEEFFKAFGIEKRCKDTEIIACSGRNSGCRKCNIFGYPEITAEKLLELICILSKYGEFKIDRGTKIDELKKSTLGLSINVTSDSFSEIFNVEEFKQQVKALFEGEE